MSILTYIKGHSVLAGTILSVAVVTAVIAGRVTKQDAKVQTTDTNIKRVTLVDVSTFRNGTSTISADGVVEAQSQADLKSQIGAPVASIDVAIGDTVSAGQIILQLENSDIRAQLDQVRGQYGSTRDSSIEKISDAYIKADAAIHSQIDQLILNNVDPRAQFYAYVVDPQLANRIRDERADLDTIFRNWKVSVDALGTNSTDASIQAALTLSQSGLDKIGSLLNDMSQALSQAANVVVPSTLPIVNAMQTTITTARNSISAAKISLSSAQVDSANASVKNLQAQLDKTVIRSPIAGQIAALPLHVGEFASGGTLVATVVGGGGVQVKAYASGEDLSRLKVGASALIQNTIPGIVTNVAPSVSALNRKVEVQIDIVNPTQSNLAVGQNVQVLIQADRPSVTTAGNSLSYTLPIQDVKIIPGEAYVFTIDADSKIVKHDVILGAIRGDFLEVTSGLTEGMKIVSPVYELEEGQQVHVE